MEQKLKLREEFCSPRYAQFLHEATNGTGHHKTINQTVICVVASTPASGKSTKTIILQMFLLLFSNFLFFSVKNYHGLLPDALYLKQVFN